MSSTRALPNANEPDRATDAATQAAPGASTQASTAEPRPPTAAAATAAATQASTAAATQSAEPPAERIYYDWYGRPSVTCPGCWNCYLLDGDIFDGDAHLEIPPDGDVYCPVCNPEELIWSRHPVKGYQAAASTAAAAVLAATHAHAELVAARAAAAAPW